MVRSSNRRHLVRRFEHDCVVRRQVAIAPCTLCSRFCDQHVTTRRNNECWAGWEGRPLPVTGVSALDFYGTAESETDACPGPREAVRQGCGRTCPNDAGRSGRGAQFVAGRLGDRGEHRRATTLHRLHAEAAGWTGPGDPGRVGMSAGLLEVEPRSGSAGSPTEMLRAGSQASAPLTTDVVDCE